MGGLAKVPPPKRVKLESKPKTINCIWIGKVAPTNF